MTTTAPAASTSADPRETFLRVFERETATTLRVLRAYPADRLDLQPHPRSNKARDLAWLFVMEQGLAQKALTTGFDWSSPPAAPPPPPESLDPIAAAFEQACAQVTELVRGLSDQDLRRTVQFFVGPKQLGDIPLMDFLWFLLHDQIHHRGQLSVYLRMAGGKVPSIYGPTADEPWF